MKSVILKPMNFFLLKIYGTSNISYLNLVLIQGAVLRPSQILIKIHVSQWIIQIALKPNRLR